MHSVRLRFNESGAIVNTWWDMSSTDEQTNFDLRTAAALRGTGGVAIAAVLFIIVSLAVGPPVSALFVFVWLWLSRTPVADIGLKRPGSWLGVLAVGVVSGAALKFAMKAVVLPYFGAPASAPIMQELHGNLNAFLIEVPQMIILAGFAEEIVFRGFFINRLQAWLGTGPASGLLIVLITAGVFGPAHYLQQGFFGALQGTIVGVLFASAYLLNGRRLWSLIVAHATFDVLAIYFIYAGLEERVAHAVFP
jgi:membrane protease YdiL (CAAX protease family)